MGHPQRAAAPDGRRTAFRDGEGRRGWYYPTRSIVANLDDIDKRCHAGSWLDLAVRSRNATYFLVEAHVDEAVATLKEDGLSIGYEKAREVLLSERDPETSEERLLLNWHRTAWHLEELAGRPCTPEIVLEVYERVSRGVERQVTRSSRQVPACGSASRSIALRRSRSCRRSSRRTAKTYAEHPLLLALGVRHLFMSVHPLPDWNGAVCSLMMKLLFRKTERPVLAYVPIVKLWAPGKAASFARPPSCRW